MGELPRAITTSQEPAINNIGPNPNLITETPALSDRKYVSMFLIPNLRW